MNQDNLFFTYQSKLNSQIKNQKTDKSKQDESLDKFEEISKTDNEWLQEYELIYSSYSIDGY